MTKVVEVLTDSNIGGAGIWVENLLLEMEDDLDMTIIMPNESLLYDRLKLIENVQLMTVQGIKDRSFSLGSIWTFWKLFKGLKPDVVHCHASLSARVAAKLLPGIYIVNSRHCVEPISKNPYKAKLKNWVNRTFSHKIHAVSKGVRDNLLAEGVPLKQIVAVDNGVKLLEPVPDSELEALADKYGTRGKKVIGFVGRLEEVKGPMDLVTIGLVLKASMDEPWMMLIAGTGGLEEPLKDAVKKAELEENVRVLGFVDRPAELYNLMDVCINTSRSEAISLTLLEAMTLKVPVMAYDVDGLDQVVIEDKNGWLMKPFEAKKYGEQLAELLKDDAKRAAFGDYAYQHVSENFTVQAMADEIYRLYKERKTYENHG